MKRKIPPARSELQAAKEHRAAVLCKRPEGATTQEMLKATGWRWTVHHESMPRIKHMAEGEGYDLIIEGVEGSLDCRYKLVRKARTKLWHPPATMIAICEQDG